MESGAFSVSRLILSFGKIGVKSSKFFLFAASNGLYPLTDCTYNKALYFSFCVLIRIFPTKISPVFKFSLTAAEIHSHPALLLKYRLPYFHCLNWIIRFSYFLFLHFHHSHYLHYFHFLCHYGDVLFLFSLIPAVFAVFFLYYLLFCYSLLF